MTNFNSVKFSAILCAVFITFSFTTLLMPDPPTVEDITVCEGEATIISPMASVVVAEQVIGVEDFEGDPDNIGFTVSNMFYDGVNDHFQATDGTDISITTGGMYSFQDGTNIFWAGEDFDDTGSETADGNDEKSMTLNAIDITNFENVKFCWSLAAGNENPPGSSAYDLADFVVVEYSVDGGAFVDGLCYAYIANGDDFNEPLASDPNCDNDGVDGLVLSNVAQNFELILPAAASAGSSVVFRITAHMDASGEEIAFDDLSVKGTPSGDVSFNYYDVNPDLDPNAVPVEMGTTFYDAGVTLATSPDTIWVTAEDPIGESTASQVIINVLPNTDAGPNQFACNLSAFQLAAAGDPALLGEWSGGMGTFSDINDPNAIYTPSSDEFNMPIVLTYLLDGALCGETDEVVLYNAEQLTADFAYPFDSICPGDGIVAPVFTDGVPGLFEVVSGNEADLDLNPMTGEIDLMNSQIGSYTIQNTVSSCGNLMISGVVDGDIPGGLPKAVELYVINNIADLSTYGVGSANNGGGTDGEELTFPAVPAMQGDYIYIASEPTEFMNFFGFAPDYINNLALINGDDAIELFCDGSVIDVFGEIDVDGSGEAWEYTNGWAYRMDLDAPNFGFFDENQWIYSGVDALDGETMNATAATPVPVGTFTTDFPGLCPDDVAEVTFVIDDFGGTMIMCPADITYALQGGECGVFANLVDPSAIDNCSPGLTLMQVSGPVTGDYLDKESAPYTVVYEGVTDLGVTVTCSYQIFIEEYVPNSATLACNGGINLSLNELCEATLTADMILEGDDYLCYDDYILTATLDGNSVGTSVANAFGTGNSLLFDNTLINQAIEVSIMEPITGNSCWGYLTLEDKLAPTIICPDTIVVECNADITAVEPLIEAECDIVTFEMEEDIQDGTCADTFFMQITRTWIAIDAAGNQSEPCVEVIFIERDVFDEIMFPLNFDDLPGNNPVLACDGAGTEYALDEDGNPSPIGGNGLIGTGEPVLGAGCSNLIIYYDDNVVPICGSNSYKVIREWTAIDWCSGETAQHTQVIKILDTEAPEFNVPDDITVGVTKHCKGEYYIPNIASTDNCDEVTINFSVDEGTVENNIFLIDSPTLGQAYEIAVTASDECGNDSVQVFTVTFIDNVPPVVIAETSLTVSLGLDGIAKVFASSFDDGSYDTCSDVEYTVLRNFSTCTAIDEDEPAGDDNFQFNDIVHFCCNDVGEPQMVTLRVCDDADGNGEFGDSDDNCNTAMVEVTVQNKQPPLLICPAATTINCIDAAGLDLTNTEMMNDLFGEPTIINACGGTTITQAIDQQSCGEGIIIRQFIALGAGQSAACAQIITITPAAENRLTCDRINFDGLNNNVYDWCDINDNNNDNDDDLPAIEIDCDESSAIPQLDIDIEGLCTEVGVNITIDTFNFAGGACKKYIVHYEVIDQCVFEENYIDTITNELDPYNSDNGYFEFYIEIDAFDNDGPQIEMVDETFVADDCESGAVSVTLSAIDNCTSEEFITYGFKVDFFSDNEIEVTNNGGFIYSNVIQSNTPNVPVFPVGEHTVFVLTTDGCGNSSTSSFKIIVEPNAKEPTPYCKTGFVASISAMGMVDVTAEMFNAGSFDNCTNSEDLIFSFSEDVNDNQITYTCDDLGFQFITVYVTDGDGNQDWCSTTFLVQDNQNFCNGSMISGMVQSENGFINKDAMVMVDDIENTSYQVETNENGYYELVDNNFSQYASVTIEDYNSTLHGISVTDLLFIRKHILGIEPFTTNAQLIAADVDNNEKINGIDIIQLRKLLLGHINTFSNHMSWVAYPADFDLESLVDPYDYPRIINLSDAENFDFTTLKVGDVNNSHSSGLHTENTADVRSKFVIEYETKIVNGEKVYELYADVSDLVGLDWNINNASFNINSNVLNIDESNVYKAELATKLIWTDIHALSGVQHILTISELDDINKLVTAENILIALTGKSSTTEEHAVVLSERTKEKDEAILSIYPNPFSDITNIELDGFDLEEISIKIFALDGRIVYSGLISNQSVITLDETFISQSGVYNIEISDSNNTITRKLIKIN